jgi:hypothetical protein
MMKKNSCVDCSKHLSKLEVALSQKMLGRDLAEFYCITCLAAFLECDREELEIKIQEFKEQGCNLFL